MSARDALVHAFIVIRLIRLDKPEPYGLIALRAWPKAKRVRRGKRFRHVASLGIQAA